MELTKTVLILVLLSLVFVVMIERNHYKGEFNDLKDENALVNQKYKSERDKNNQLVVTQVAIETRNKSLIDSITKDFELKIKKVKSAIVYSYTTKIDTFRIKSKDTFFLYKNGEKVKEFKDSNAYYTIEADVDTLVSRLKINKIEFRDTILTVEESKGIFFKKTEYKIISKSPYSNISGMKSIKIKPQPRKGIKILALIGTFILGFKTYEYIH